MRMTSFSDCLLMRNCCWPKAYEYHLPEYKRRAWYEDYHQHQRLWNRWMSWRSRFIQDCLSEQVMVWFWRNRGFLSWNLHQIHFVDLTASFCRYALESSSKTEKNWGWVFPVFFLYQTQTMILQWSWNCIHVISPFEKSEYEGNEVSLFQFGYTHSLSRYDSISISNLYDETIVVRKKGTVRCHDIFREDIQHFAKKIEFHETDGFYTFDTINSCIHENMILLSLEKWAGTHPFLKMVRIVEDYPVPYGLVCRT